jgi:hypothetical protein
VNLKVQDITNITNSEFRIQNSEFIINFTSKLFAIGIVLSSETVYYTIEWMIFAVLLFCLAALKKYKFDDKFTQKVGLLYVFIKDLTAALITLILLHVFYLAVLILPLAKMYLFGK